MTEKEIEIIVNEFIDKYVLEKTRDGTAVPIEFILKNCPEKKALMDSLKFWIKVLKEKK